MIPKIPLQVPRDIFRTTLHHLRTHGEDGYECFALWLGQVCERTIKIVHLEVPAQVSSHVRTGCHVRVEGDELLRMSLLAHERDALICAQVHSHPGAAYHSEIDDAAPLVSLPGSVSLVVPNFAQPPIDLAEWAAYRLQGDGSWDSIDPDAVLEVVV